MTTHLFTEKEQPATRWRCPVTRRVVYWAPHLPVRCRRCNQMRQARTCV